MCPNVTTFYLPGNHLPSSLQKHKSEISDPNLDIYYDTITLKIHINIANLMVKWISISQYQPQYQVSPAAPPPVSWISAEAICGGHTRLQQPAQPAAPTQLVPRPPPSPTCYQVTELVKIVSLDVNCKLTKKTCNEICSYKDQLDNFFNQLLPTILNIFFSPFWFLISGLNIHVDIDFACSWGL